MQRELLVTDDRNVHAVCEAMQSRNPVMVVGENGSAWGRPVKIAARSDGFAVTVEIELADRSRSSVGSEHRTSNSAVAGSSPAGNATPYYPPGHYPVGDALPLDACIHCRCRPCNCASPAH